eukprot:m.203034 g.203034  ORF g.203034 m.203034 type:complete len:138 (+) comp25994_c2_seq7:56-469(+)
MPASFNGLLEVTKIFVAGGADLNLQDKDRLTALMLASFNGHFEVAKILVAAGADLNLKSKNGLTALDYAQRRNYSEIVALLKRPPPSWSFAAHCSLLPQRKYRQNLKFLVWCLARRRLPCEMLWYVLGFLKLSEMNQ